MAFSTVQLNTPANAKAADIKIATIKQMSGKTYPVLRGVIHKHNVI